jgi:hypothetical protein
MNDIDAAKGLPETEELKATQERVAVSLSVILCAGHNQRQGGVLCRAEPRSWTVL